MVNKLWCVYGMQVEGEVVKVEPITGCVPVINNQQLQGKIGIVERGDCMFIDKVNLSPV